MSPKKSSTPRGKPTATVRITKSKRTDLKARPTSAKAAERKFGKAARVAAEQGGRKPSVWQEADRPKRRVQADPPVDIFAPLAHGVEITVARTLDGSMSAVFRAFNDPERRAWCHERGYAVRGAIAPRMLRLAFVDGTSAGVAIARQGNARCSVSVSLSRLTDHAAADRARQQWKASLEHLSVMLDA